MSTVDRGGAPGGPPKAPPLRIPAAALREFAIAVFQRTGVSAQHAAVWAEPLIWANLRGVDTHGVLRIPRYVELMEEGAINPKPVMRVQSDMPASVVIEADCAPGPVALAYAAGAAEAKARAAGIGMALVRATTHTGAVGYTPRQLALRGLAAIAVTASWPVMAYHGARALGVSTNPISIAVPSGAAEPLLLDMSTAVVPLGKLIQAKKSGVPLEPGWALDKDGKATTDPMAAQIPLPLGGPKGSGLSLMIECLTSILASNPVLSGWLEKTPEGTIHRQNAMLIVIDIARFIEPATFAREVARMARNLKDLPKSEGTDEILMPGERGERMLAKRSREGIPVPAPILQELETLAARLGIDHSHWQGR